MQAVIRNIPERAATVSMAMEIGAAFALTAWFFRGMIGLAYWTLEFLWA